MDCTRAALALADKSAFDRPNTRAAMMRGIELAATGKAHDVETMYRYVSAAAHLTGTGEDLLTDMRAMCNGVQLWQQLHELETSQ